MFNNRWISLSVPKNALPMSFQKPVKIERSRPPNTVQIRPMIMPSRAVGVRVFHQFQNEFIWWRVWADDGSRLIVPLLVRRTLLLDEIGEEFSIFGRAELAEFVEV